MFSRGGKSKSRLKYLEYIAYHDNLTGLKNRMYLYDKLELSEYKWLYFVDINNLHEINCENGHLYGDTYIKAVVDGICATIAGNGLCVRYGGDEFIVFGKEKLSLVSNDEISVGMTEIRGMNLNDAINLSNMEMLKGRKRGR